jgi:hypothetical protein
MGRAAYRRGCPRAWPGSSSRMRETNFLDEDPISDWPREQRNQEDGEPWNAAFRALGLIGAVLLIVSGLAFAGR